jgi:hypothetical protein
MGTGLPSETPGVMADSNFFERGGPQYQIFTAPSILATSAIGRLVHLRPPSAAFCCRLLCVCGLY